MKATKKELGKHTKKFDRELGHPEGSKHWCDCRTRNYREKLGLRLHGPYRANPRYDLEDI